MSLLGGLIGGKKETPAPAPLPVAAPPAAAPSADVELRRQAAGRQSLAWGVTDLENEVDSLGAPAGGARRRTASKTLLG